MTITPHLHAVYHITATLKSPFHHGAGSSGNTSLLRTQEVIQPDGTIARVPFLSGGAIRHGLREAMAWHLIHTLEVEPGSLSKASVDLLFTGGAVSSTGARTNLDMLRQVEEHLPMLAMFGYAAKADIVTGTLRASDMILVCTENTHRLKNVSENLKKAAFYRSEEFGTRHDQANGPAGRFIDTFAGEQVTTTQMIWDTQVLNPGATLECEIGVTPAATEMHKTCLIAALQLWAPQGEAHIGAKTAQGYGKAHIQFPAPDFQESPALETWEQHLHDHKTDILNLIDELGSK